MNRLLLAISASILLIAQMKGQESERPNIHKVTVTSSWITIHGQTNVNNFHCGLNKASRTDSVVVKNIWTNQKLDFEGFTLHYKIDDFECGLQAMNKDFRELLEAKKSPFLTLQINSISLLADNQSFEELDVNAEVEVQLAGVRKSLEILQGKVLNHSPAHLTLMGNKELHMSEFGIVPPTKFFGMIKVTDEIEIQFEISIVVSAA